MLKSCLYCLHLNVALVKSEANPDSIPPPSILFPLQRVSVLELFVLGKKEGLGEQSAVPIEALGDVLPLHADIVFRSSVVLLCSFPQFTTVSLVPSQAILLASTRVP